MNEEKNTELNIRIGSLAIEGVSLTFYQKQQVKASFENALTALFSEKGIPNGIKNLGVVLQGKPIDLQPSQYEPSQLGKQLATSVYLGLTQEL
jgi:hypothetical protein